MSNQPKPVAQGFVEDVAKLLRSFAELQTTDFPAFASLWKQHSFSLIFMGRPDDFELTEFTNETYKVASQYLLSSSFYFEVGAIFLLYGLYRNQISDPPIKIRIELRHWKAIDTIQNQALLNSYKTLHYVIDYLTENAFVYVYHQVLKGPMIATVKAEPRKSEAYSSIKTTYKSDINEYLFSNSLQLLNDLHNEYAETKEWLEDVKISKGAEKDIYAKYLKELEALVQTGSRPRKTAKKDKNGGDEESIGARRAKIKAQSFINKSVDFWGRNADDEEAAVAMNEEQEDEYVPQPQHFKRLHGRRARAHKREKREKRVGRPRKNPVKEEEKPSDEQTSDEKPPEGWLDISEFPEEQDEFYFPPTKEFTATGRRRRASRFHYYKLSPRHGEDEEEYTVDGDVTTV